VAAGAPAAVLGFAPSGLPGPKGNRETFVWLGERGRAGEVEDLDAAVAGVDA
jgi:23S rRNA (cytidine1920-2'-O)/16S rRNA (cytidine1409-2'-O)-methyltransferase